MLHQWYGYTKPLWNIQGVKKQASSKMYQIKKKHPAQKFNIDTKNVPYFKAVSSTFPPRQNPFWVYIQPLVFAEGKWWNL